MKARKKSKEIAYDYLFNEIVSNRLTSGSPIIEQNIAAELDISRTPIREAIKQLESQNLVVCYPFQGTYVSTLGYEEIQEACGLRAAIEVFALEKSIYLFTDKELDKLKEGFLQTVGDVSDYQTVDASFHDMIVTKSNYKLAKDIFGTLNIQIERFRNISRNQFSNRGSASLQEHLELIELIRERNLSECQEKLKRHLENVTNFFTLSAAP